MPDAEVKKNLLFDLLIKRYKYISGKSPIVAKQEKVLKNGQFRIFDTASMRTLADSAEKKNVIVQTKLQKPLDLESAVIAAASGKPSPQNNIKAQNRSNINSVDHQAGLTDKTAVERSVIEAKIREEYKTRLQSEIESAYDKGLQEGRQTGLAEGKAEAEKVSQIINHVIVEFNKESQKFFDEVEEVIMDLSVHLASKIIGDAVTAIPDIIKTNVEKCVGLLAGAGNVLVKINPSDYDTIKEYLPKLDQKYEGKYSFIIEPENNITRGGCLVEMDGSVIDGRIEAQYEKIKQHMEMLV